MNFSRRQPSHIPHCGLPYLRWRSPSPSDFAIAKKDKRDHHQLTDEQKRALHALNRLAFGPRPGDVERVAAMGVDKWIDQQLHPDKIDDHALDARLAAVPYASHEHA